MLFKNIKINVPVLVLYVVCFINFSVIFNLSQEVKGLKQTVQIQHEILEERSKLDKKIEGVLDDISTNLHKQNKAKEVAMKKTSINTDTDLKLTVNYTAEEMDKIIDEWNTHVKNGTPFKGQGHVFVKAAEETGLNPIYIFAHAAWESGWGNSHIAKDKNNYYGINAVDRSSYSSAYAMGDSLEEGIISGAKWIKDNYYNEGKTSLNKMIYGGKTYASDKDKWISGIVSIANTSIAML